MQVRAEGVVRRFGRKRVVDGLTLTCAPRSMTALVGPSGCGKSTILGILAGLDPPSDGCVEHVDESGVVVARPARLIAWVNQASSVIPHRSAIDNVLIGPLSTGIRLDRAEHMALVAMRTVGVRGLASTEVRLLSGGERQRVALARALASGLPEVFADEPTAHLDRASTDAVIAALVAVAAERLVVVATHDPALAAAAHQVVDLRSLTRAAPP